MQNRYRKILLRLVHVIDQTSVVISTTLVAVMTIVVLMQVASRFFFNSPLAWTEELGRVLLFAMVYFGIVSVSYRGNDLRVDLVDAFLPERVKAAVTMFTELVSFLAAIYAGYWAVRLADRAAYVTLPALGFSWWYVYIIIAVTFGAEAIRNVVQLATGRLNLLTAEYSGDEK